jgi:photosystem II stability/assembly factor-like uncharacterized protein
MRTMLLVGTPKGAFILESDETRRDWSMSSPMCEGWPIHDMIVEPGSGAILAGGGSPWYGPAVWRSDDLGATWTHSSAGLTYGDDGAAAVKTVWSLATTPDRAILAGVEPAGLFRSEDGGRTWSHVTGLTNHPTRPGWQPGAGGLILHTIVPHPDDPARCWVGISAVGVFETTDGGATWEPRNRGVRADFNPDPHPVTGQCVHKFAMAAGEPETLYQQNHCGQYRSTDGGSTWTDLSPNGLPSEFGFPLVTHPRDPATIWVIPLNGADQGRFVPGASAAVWRTHDRGDTWIRGDRGLPQQDAYFTILREAMARDALDPVGVAFGTETGQLWHSADGGESWRLVTADLPGVWSVETHAING